MKNQIQFANIFETLVQGLHKHLNQIEDAQIGFLCVHGKNKIQGSVMSIYQFDIFSPLRNGALQIIAKRIGPGCHLRKHATYHALLELFRFDGLIEFDQPGFPVIVHDYYSFDHNNKIKVLLLLLLLLLSTIVLYLLDSALADEAGRWMQEVIEYVGRGG